MSFPIFFKKNYCFCSLSSCISLGSPSFRFVLTAAKPSGQTFQASLSNATLKDRGDRPTVTRFAYDRGQSPCPEAYPERFVPSAVERGRTTVMNAVSDSRLSPVLALSLMQDTEKHPQNGTVLPYGCFVVQEEAGKYRSQLSCGGCLLRTLTVARLRSRSYIEFFQKLSWLVYWNIIFFKIFFISCYYTINIVCFCNSILYSIFKIFPIS